MPFLNASPSACRISHCKLFFPVAWLPLLPSTSSFMAWRWWCLLLALLRDRLPSGIAPLVVLSSFFDVFSLCRFLTVVDIGFHSRGVILWVLIYLCYFRFRLLSLHLSLVFPFPHLICLLVFFFTSLLNFLQISLFFCVGFVCCLLFFIFFSIFSFRRIFVSLHHLFPSTYISKTR